MLQTCRSRPARPTLMVAGVHGGQVSAARVRELYEDFGAAEKVSLDLGCASHNAMWERNHLILFGASLEWLNEGTVEGQSEGIVRLRTEISSRHVPPAAGKDGKDKTASSRSKVGVLYLPVKSGNRHEDPDRQGSAGWCRRCA